LWIGTLEAKDQYMLEVLKLSELKEFLGDGLVGLGFAKLSAGHLTLIDNLFEQKLISEKVDRNIFIFF
jgi:hypothetical protein